MYLPVFTSDCWWLFEILQYNSKWWESIITWKLEVFAKDSRISEVSESDMGETFAMQRTPLTNEEPANSCQWKDRKQEDNSDAPKSSNRGTNDLKSPVGKWMKILHKCAKIKQNTPCRNTCCWERLRAGGEGDDRGWDGWMASPTQWTWIWASSGIWWRTGKPGVIQPMGSQRVGHDWATEQ